MNSSVPPTSSRCSRPRKGEPVAEFQQEFLDVRHQRRLEFRFGEGFRQLRDVERVRVLRQFAREVAVQGRKGRLEVRDGPPLPLVKPQVHVVREDGAGPAVAGDFPDVEKGVFGSAHEFVDEQLVVSPRDGEKRFPGGGGIFSRNLREIFRLEERFHFSPSLGEICGPGRETCFSPSLGEIFKLP